MYEYGIVFDFGAWAVVRKPVNSDLAAEVLQTTNSFERALAILQGMTQGPVLLKLVTRPGP